MTDRQTDTDRDGDRDRDFGEYGQQQRQYRQVDADALSTEPLAQVLRHCEHLYNIRHSQSRQQRLRKLLRDFTINLSYSCYVCLYNAVLLSLCVAVCCLILIISSSLAMTVSRYRRHILVHKALISLYAIG